LDTTSCCVEEAAPFVKEKARLALLTVNCGGGKV